MSGPPDGWETPDRSGPHPGVAFLETQAQPHQAETEEQDLSDRRCQIKIDAQADQKEARAQYFAP
ncbi:hypothetical protein CEW89_19665 [Celeribacter ethanolicus]|uniref:Uncharacterized protein n=1 Tax=Celeribacter ethanolicus TaxID=1758178 RepID=A0A291GHS3_9RHOB|nr:hypothetical protein CEW89_19665 [Celeribacter ethanolicus]